MKENIKKELKETIEPGSLWKYIYGVFWGMFTMSLFITTKEMPSNIRILSFALLALSILITTITLITVKATIKTIADKMMKNTKD